MDLMGAALYPQGVLMPPLRFVAVTRPRFMRGGSSSNRCDKQRTI